MWIMMSDPTERWIRQLIMSQWPATLTEVDEAAPRLADEIRTIVTGEKGLYFSKPLTHIGGVVGEYVGGREYHDSGSVRQALALAEEVGECIQAFRRWRGDARRNGPLEDVVTELADVIITAAVFAHELGIDLDVAVLARYQAVLARPIGEAS
jgi:NTP pyrophosphatase (non-canonical NTP hydrolase)